LVNLVVTRRSHQLAPSVRLFDGQEDYRDITSTTQRNSVRPKCCDVLAWGGVQGESYGVDSVGRSGCNARAPLLHHILDFYCD